MCTRQSGPVGRIRHRFEIPTNGTKSCPETGEHARDMPVCLAWETE